MCDLVFVLRSPIYSTTGRLFSLLCSWLCGVSWRWTAAGKHITTMFVLCCAAALSDILFWCFLKDRDYCAKVLSHSSFICILQGTWKLGFLNYIQVGCLLFHSASGLNKRALVCSHSCLICKADQNRWTDIGECFCFNFFFLNDSLYIIYMIKLTEKQQQKQKKQIIPLKIITYKEWTENEWSSSQ